MFCNIDSCLATGRSHQPRGAVEANSIAVFSSRLSHPLREVRNGKARLTTGLSKSHPVQEVIVIIIKVKLSLLLVGTLVIYFHYKRK